MKIKTDKLTGAALDWAVAKCEGKDISVIGSAVLLWVGKDSNIDYEPSTNWAQGGAIIDREKISILTNELARKTGDEHLLFIAMIDGPKMPDLKAKATGHGPTHLIAAMRCFVASKLGGEVDVPGELVG